MFCAVSIVAFAGLIVEDIVGPREQLVTVQSVMKVQDMINILQNCSHHGFPVIKDAESDHILLGLCERKHMVLALHHNDFHIDKPEPFTRIPRKLPRKLFQLHKAEALSKYVCLNYEDLDLLGGNSQVYSRSSSSKIIDGISSRLQADELQMWVDISPYVSVSPQVVSYHTPVSGAYKLFSKLGVRHVVAVDRSGRVGGMIVRHDLVPSRLKIVSDAKRERRTTASSFQLLTAACSSEDQDPQPTVLQKKEGIKDRISRMVKTWVGL